MNFFQVFVGLFTCALMSTSCTKGNENPTDEVKAVLDKVIDDTAKMGEKQADRMGSLIKKFQSETDAFERFKLCAQITIGNMSHSLKSIKNGARQEPLKYADEIKMAGKYCEEAMNKVTLFEQGLTDSDWEQISSGVKDSNLKKTRKFLASRPKDCSEADISKVIDTGDKAFQQVTTMGALMVVINTKELQNFDQYFPRYKAILESKNHPDKVFLLKYLKYYGDRYRKNRNEKRDRELLATKTQRLLKEGVSDTKVAAAKALSLAPHCFAGISMSGIKNAKIIFNRKRMTGLRDFLSNKNIDITKYIEPSSDQSDWYDLKYEKHDELEKAGLEYRDVYGRPFYVRPQHGRIQVFSLGKDKRANTEDDQII